MTLQLLDASVAIKWFVPDETGHSEALQLLDTVRDSGQIAPEDLPAIVAAGIRTVICNRPDEEVPVELQSATLRIATEAAGLVFVDNPVTHADLDARVADGAEQHGVHLADAVDVVGDDRMIRTENRTELVDALDAAAYALLVKVVAEQVHAVGTAHVIAPVAIQAAHANAVGRLGHAAERQGLLHEAAKLERHPVGVGELHVRDLRLELCTGGARASAPGGQPFAQPAEAVAAPGYDLIVSAMAMHHVEDTDALVQGFADHLKPGARVALADLDAEDGTFHPADAEGVFHHGFDRGTFQSILESKGFQDVSFVTAHTVNREGKSYPIFLVTAVKAG